MTDRYGAALRKIGRLKAINAELVEAVTILFALDCVCAADYETEKIEAVNQARAVLAKAREIAP